MFYVYFYIFSTIFFRFYSNDPHILEFIIHSFSGTKPQPRTNILDLDFIFILDPTMWELDVKGWSKT